MSDGRRQSRSKGREKIGKREEIEALLIKHLEQDLVDTVPDIRAVAVRVASKLAAMIASQIAVQPQSKQRSLSVIEDDVPDYAAEFVAQLMQAAVRGIRGQVKKTTVAKVDGVMGMALPDDWAGPVAGPTLLERTFGIPRSTLHRWRRLNQAVAINTRTTQKPVFPLLQFVDGSPVKGISDVIAAKGDPKKAWLWLITPSSHLDGAQPIALLRDGQQGTVVAAAKIESISMFP